MSRLETVLFLTTLALAFMCGSVAQAWADDAMFARFIADRDREKMDGKTHAENIADFVAGSKT